MKRCMVCGNEGDDNAAACTVCGSPYTDRYTEESAETEAPVQAEVRRGRETGSRRPAQPGRVGPSSRRMKSQPQIYGQSDLTPGGAAYDQQGAIRKNVQGRPSGGPQSTGYTAPSGARKPMGAAGAQRRPADQRPGQAIPGADTQRRPGDQAPPADRGAGSKRRAADEMASQNRPGNPEAGQSRRPFEQMAGQGRPMNPGAGPQRRPTDQMAGQNRPINPVPGQTGRPVVVNRPFGQNPNPAGRPMQGMRQDAQSGGYQSRQLMDQAREMLQSPIFLVLAILHTVFLAGSVAAVFMNQLNYSQAVRLIKGMALPGQVSGYVQTLVSLLSKLDSGAIVANLVLHIPDLLFCIGLWLIFVMAMTAKDEMSGIGFGFLKATVFINMAISCVVMLAVLIVSVAVVIAAWVSKSISMMVISGVVLVLLIAVVMFVIMYYFCYLATLKTCRLNSKAGEEYGSVSVYVAVVHILLALMAVINLLAGIVNSEIANIISGAGSIGWMLLFALWIFLYKGKMREYEA